MTETKKPRLDDLRPDHEKITPSFEGYKLSLDPLVVKEQELSCPARKLLPSNSQWSFQHALFFARYNGLFYDYWQDAKHVLATLLSDMSVWQACWNEKAEKFDIAKVADLELEFDHCVEESNRVNASISFPSKEYALLSEGAGRLLIFFTGDRSNCNTWKHCADFQLLEVTKEAFVIVDSKICPGSNGGFQIDCVLECIQKAEEDGQSVEGASSSGTFQSDIFWMTLVESQGNWRLARTRKLTCDKGVIKYCALNTEKDAICVISSLRTRFTYDSERPVEQSKAAVQENNNTLPEYLWSQSAQEVVILFPHVPSQHVNTDDIIVDFSSKSLCVEIRGHRVLLEGELTSEIEPNKSSWSTSIEGRLKITLAKKNEGIAWNSLIPTDQRGAYRKSLEVLEEICDRLEQFTSSEEVATKMEDYQQAFNTEQLEECDVPESQTAFLTWLDGNSHDVLRQADIGGYPFLFSVKCDARKPPLFCLRHLVDGVLWQVHNDFSSDHCWSHFATFNAFGYIQAGNANRKYYACATDCSYAYVAEEKKRVRIYWQPQKLNGVLTNRRTGEKVETRAVQQMITLNNQEEIWGIVALPVFMFILTESRSVSRKRKLDVTSPAGKKKARVADKQKVADDHSSSSSETSSDDDSEVDHETNNLSKAKPNAADARSVPVEELSTSSTSDSSEVEKGKLKGDTKIAPNQIAQMPAAKRGGKATVLAAEESDSSTDSAPPIIKSVSAARTRASPAQQKRLAASRDSDSKGAAVRDATKKGAVTMTPRSCVIGKQASKTVSNKESVSLGKNVATRKSVTLSTTVKRASPAAEKTSESSDDTSSAEAAPVKKLTSGLIVEKKNQQGSSSNSSSEEEPMDDKENVVHPKHPLTSKSNVRVSGEGRQLNDKAVSGKGKPVKQVAPQTSSSSESSSSDESAVKTGSTKVVTRSAGKIVNSKAASSSDESSSEDDGSDEIQKNVTAAALAKARQPQQDDSSSSDSSSTGEDFAIGTRKPLASSEKKVDHHSIAQQVAKQAAVSTSSSDSSSSEDELLPEKKPLSKGLASVEVKKNKKSVEEFIKQAEQDVSSSSESSSDEEDSSQNGKQQVKVSKKVEQSTLKQKTKAAVAGGVVAKSSSTSSESMDELTLQLKDKLAGSSFSQSEKKMRNATKGSTTPMAKTALKFSPSNDVLKRAAGVKKQNVTPKPKQAVEEDTSSSSSEEDLVANGKGFDSSFGKVEGPGGKGNLKKTAPMPVRQEVQKDSSSGDSSTSDDEDTLEKKKTLTSSAKKEETSKTNVGVRKNVPLVSKQSLAEVSSSSSESSSDEDLPSTRKKQVQQGACKKTSNQLVTDGQKSSAGTHGEKKQLTSKTVKMTSGKSEAMNDADTSSSDTSSDDESVEQECQKSAKAATRLLKPMQMTKSQQAVRHSSSSSSESSSDEGTVAKTPTANVKGKAELGKESSCTGKRMQKSVGSLETNAESKHHVKSPAVNLSISKTEPASKNKKQKGKVLPIAEMSAATKVSPSVTDSSAANKRRRDLSSAESSDLSSTDAKRSRQSTNMNSSVNTLVHDRAVKSMEGNAEQVFGSASPNRPKSAEVIKNNGPYRRFTAGKDQLNQEFRDNSYRAKKGDTWGQKAYEDLAPVKGKNFRKEKTKKKRGSYKGGKIDPNAIGSIKFPDNDE